MPETAIVFCGDRPLIVRAEVEQEFIGQVTVGQQAWVEDEVAPDKTFSGRVVRIARWYSDRRRLPASPAAFSDVPTVECVIAFDANHPPLTIGQRVQVRIGDK
jgi:HlyD family secretion protein